MKKQNIKELKEKEIKVLTKELNELNVKLAKLRMDLAFRKLKNIREIRETRKLIARIWTIIGQKAMEKIVAQEVTK